MSIKILLTGRPGVGKSTLLRTFLEHYDGPVKGTITHEIRNNEGVRVGFTTVNFAGESRLLAHVSEIQSEHVIGNKYHVDLGTLTEFVLPELAAAGATTSEAQPPLIILDEIGRMQALSPEFLAATKQLLASDQPFLGTIVLDPEPWSLEFKNDPHVVLVEVTEDNRDRLATAMTTIFNQASLFNQLTVTQQAQVLGRLREYFQAGQYVQIGKLFQNALVYLTGGKVRKVRSVSVPRDDASQQWQVDGNTRSHIVTAFRTRGTDHNETEWQCDCDLFLGVGAYQGQSGVCSHIQAVQLSRADDASGSES